MSDPTRLKVTKSFYDLRRSKKRIKLLRGGGGSGKSVGAAQHFSLRAIENPGETILVARKTLPALKVSCIPLIRSILREFPIKTSYNKSENILVLENGSKFIFKSIDDVEKIKSIADVTAIWAEELTEFGLEDFRQLNIRLRPEKAIPEFVGTFNPIDANHWIKREYEDKQDKTAEIFLSTYHDNPFLTADYIQILENLQSQDQNYYRIYCKGEWGIAEGVIYSNWQVINNSELPPTYDDEFYGLDFGFHRTALVKVCTRDEKIYIMRELYESGLTNSELIKRLELFGIGRRTIFADSAEPARIKEIYRAGFDIRPANKSVPDGIDCMKRRPMFIRKECPNTIKEIQGYVWKKDKNGNLLDEPVKFNDHAMDACRYAILSDWESKRGGYQRLMVH